MAHHALPVAHHETVTAGDWRVTLVRAGVLTMAAQQLLGPDAGSDLVDIASNVLVLEGHGRTLLVDAGGGPVAGWHAGSDRDLGVALAAAGVAPAAVDSVLLTHLDFDHVGGVATGAWPDGIEPRFGVPVLATRAALEAARGDTAGGERNAATPIVRLLDRAGLTRVVEPGAEVAAGVVIRDAPGHRVGHVVLEIGSAGAGETLLYIADAVHHTEQVARPELDGAWDDDVEVALATRMALLAEAQERGTLVAGSHLERVGRVRGGAWVVR